MSLKLKVSRSKYVVLYNGINQLVARASIVFKSTSIFKIQISMRQVVLVFTSSYFYFSTFHFPFVSTCCVYYLLFCLQTCHLAQKIVTLDRRFIYFLQIPTNNNLRELRLNNISVATDFRIFRSVTTLLMLGFRT